MQRLRLIDHGRRWLPGASLSPEWQEKRKPERGFLAVNMLLILGYGFMLMGVSTSVQKTLIVIALLISIGTGIRDIGSGLGCYFSMAAYTGFSAIAMGSAYGASVKDVGLAIVLAARYLIIPLRAEEEAKPIRYSGLVRASFFAFGVLCIVQAGILVLHYKTPLVLAFGMRANFVYIILAALVGQLSIKARERVFRMLLFCSICPCLVGIDQFLEMKGVRLPVPSLIVSQQRAEAVYEETALMGKEGLGLLEGGELPRTPGTMTSPAQFACLLLCASCTWLFMSYKAGREYLDWGEIERRKVLSLCAYGILITCGLLACGNRTPLIIHILGIVGVAMAFTADPVRARNRRAAIVGSRSKFVAIGFIIGIFASIAGSFGVALFEFPALRERYFAGIGSQINERLFVVRDQFTPFGALPAWQQLFGVGSGTQSSAIRYLGDRIGDIWVGGALMESQFFTQITELGYIGAAIYLLARAIVLAKAISPSVSRRVSLLGEYSYPILVPLTIITLIPYGNFLIYDPMNAFYWILFGILCRHVSL